MHCMLAYLYIGFQENPATTEWPVVAPLTTLNRTGVAFLGKHWGCVNPHLFHDLTALIGALAIYSAVAGFSWKSSVAGQACKAH